MRWLWWTLRVVLAVPSLGLIVAGLACGFEMVRDLWTHPSLEAAGTGLVLVLGAVTLVYLGAWVFGDLSRELLEWCTRRGRLPQARQLRL